MLRISSSCQKTNRHFRLVPSLLSAPSVRSGDHALRTNSAFFHATGRAGVSLTEKQPLARQRGRSTKIAQPCSRSKTKHACCYTTVSMAPQPIIHDIFESKTGTWQYVVADPVTKVAVIIDPVLDYDRTTQVINTSSADGLLSLIKTNGYTISRVLETHAHADHLTAASYLQNRLTLAHEPVQGYMPSIGIGKRISQVQDLFSQRYGVPSEEIQGVFDKLFNDDEEFAIGDLRATALHLPGHTPDHLGYKIGDNVFCGDSLFHVDIGTARCDFPGGSANNLFHSGRRLLSLPDHVKLWTGHDYPPKDRAQPVAWMTVRDHKKHNIHLRDSITEAEFVARRKRRDASLGEPKLLHQSLQTNIRAGRLPQPTASGHRMFRLPVKLGGLQW
ncbi:Putative metallo-beta-lactamase, ribonuclease Z/Hydroxyacylglutathione hydrolase [Colletotrichum destructivum]|uniref:Metallo-beta-lactamase, ribonuclease Z/Hydroxyacylglutathione hydrolase n=1 Tax=Colletotrichum destructivum TaxID=34406 RepID=A0AAX4IH65_9PEZI|nr:Putative metallo-beta-lactamase, ribonuclease Z/Hydroxyacylglutathione hydrolase [Colletotrichum destructivum]